MVPISESPPLLSTANADKQHVPMVRGRAVTCTEVPRERVPPRGEVGPVVEGCEGEGMGDMGGRRAACGKSSGVGRVGGEGRREAQRSGEGVGEGRNGKQDGVRRRKRL